MRDAGVKSELRIGLPGRLRLGARGEHAAHLDDQRVWWTGLGDEPVAACTRGTLQLTGTIVRRQSDHGYVRGSVVALQLSRRFPAVHQRQAEIHQHDVRHERGGMGDGLQAVYGFDDFEAAQRELLGIELPKLVLVFHQQNERSLTAAETRKLVCARRHVGIIT